MVGVFRSLDPRIRVNMAKIKPMTGGDRYLLQIEKLGSAVALAKRVHVIDISHDLARACSKIC
jgi:hypothetical protein